MTGCNCCPSFLLLGRQQKDQSNSSLRSDFLAMSAELGCGLWASRFMRLKKKIIAPVGLCNTGTLLYTDLGREQMSNKKNGQM